MHLFSASSSPAGDNALRGGLHFAHYFISLPGLRTKKQPKMKLKDILSISGQPGLYKFVAQASNGIIVESLADGKRSNARGSAKVSSLAEIAIYTDTDELPLSKVFEKMYEKTGGKETIDRNSTPDQMKALFADVIPDYDRDRVHVSDMKKMIAWFNILVKAGMSDFSVEETEETEEPEAEKKAE